jgi:hypothetical protein
MRIWQCVLLLVALPIDASASDLTPARAAAVEDGVRAFARTVAHDITQEGPTAWRKLFSQSPSFFMAVDGHLVFPSGAAARTAIQDLSRTIQHIELQWGDDLRVDPLAPDLAMLATSYHEVRVSPAGGRVEENGFFTGLAEYREGHWQFRNAHWSVALPAPAVH